MRNSYLIPEWAPQSAILLTWPHANSDWADNLSAIEPYYTELALTIAETQHVLILCENNQLKQRVKQQLKAHSNIDYILIKTNDTWIRDYGPITIKNNHETHYLDFNFNAWGGKFDSTKDNAVNQQLMHHPLFQQPYCQTVPLVFEGGAMETNGNILLTTTSCALDQRRNPGITESTFQETMHTVFGCPQTILLNHGQLAGDDTDGHIDTIVRFTDPNTLCYVSCHDKHHPNYQTLQQLQHELSALPFNLIELPQPDCLSGQDGHLLPATYANFLITNDAVLVPTYQLKTDDTALGILSDCFPHRRIKGIDCRALIEQNGSLHCSTMQLPL